jgi:GNAT superfamily N-acetyltransferase
LQSSVNCFAGLQKRDCKICDNSRRHRFATVARGGARALAIQPRVCFAPITIGNFAPAMRPATSDLARNPAAGADVKLLPSQITRSNISAMDQLVIAVRQARPEDAAQVARVYIESWHDTYAGILPNRMLCSMTPRGQTARWRAAIRARGREMVLVAECGAYGVVGMASFGPSRDGALGYDGEVYTLYVDPAFYGRGSGRALMRGAFATLNKRGHSSCVIWAHARNPVRFFYEAMGGRVIAERTAQMMGDPVPETAFGWRRLALAERSNAR